MQTNTHTPPSHTSRYVNVLLKREAPSRRRSIKLRRLGEEVITALVSASSGKEVTPYFHSLVCAIPRQSAR